MVEPETLTWETACDLARAAGWERAEMRPGKLGGTYVRLWYGTRSWENRVPLRSTAEAHVVYMLETDAINGNRIRDLYINAKPLGE